MTHTVSKQQTNKRPGVLRRWLNTRAQRAELRALPAGELERVMLDLGMSARDVDRLQADHPGPQELLPKRLEAMGLDPGYLREAQPATLRDMERVCATCAQYGRCQHDLERDDANQRLPAYCPNTATIDALLVERP